MDKANIKYNVTYDFLYGNINHLISQNEVWGFRSSPLGNELVCKVIMNQEYINQIMRKRIKIYFLLSLI